MKRARSVDLPLELWTADVMRHLGADVVSLTRLARACTAFAASQWHRHVRAFDGTHTKRLTYGALRPYAATLEEFVLVSRPDAPSIALTLGLARCISLRRLTLFGDPNPGLFYGPDARPPLPPSVTTLVIGRGFVHFVRRLVKALPALCAIELHVPKVSLDDLRHLGERTFTAGFLARATITIVDDAGARPMPSVWLAPWQPTGWDPEY